MKCFSMCVCVVFYLLCKFCLMNMFCFCLVLYNNVFFYLVFSFNIFLLFFLWGFLLEI